MRVLIVDDERPARDKLRRLLAQEPDISAVAEARDGVEALELLAEFAPDLLLLDIEMPEVSGLDVAASLPAPAPVVVFVTAYDNYAIRAFDANAIDYLLKPYDQQRLRRALDRARARLTQPAAPANALAPPPALPAQAQAQVPPPVPAPVPAQLLVPERGGMRVVRIDDIAWIETADNYVVLHTADGQPLLRQTLAGLLATLGPRFVRCHRRAAVQLQWVEGLDMLDKGDGELLLRGGARVPCSRQFRQDVLARLQAGPGPAPDGSPHRG
ncbi:two-component system response regulator [Duganella sp. Leaf126]|uniref:LytR/AlgR family response regulator transcription factor n=1 Tax=Duganella sp. Leaf126 TaxID=1736266 RepID=UPI0006FEF990|nr:LytTR family DNA-binding domain-containing protein [Duganella sp. Leaf126]KQQ40187.1 two-component system response regulator [Duganella sp. Leaf126]